MQLTTPIRPKEHTEQALLAAILDGTFPPGTSLPGERTLAAQLGVTRPTLREAIQRLERDGWLTVSQGKTTSVNNYWEEGGLNVLGALAMQSDRLPPNFICQLLEVRLHLAPAYTSLAVDAHSEQAAHFLAEGADVADTPEAFAAYDWLLHRRLTIWSENPIYTMILNGFAGFYEDVAVQYFDSQESRLASRRFYQQLWEMAVSGDAVAAADLTRAMMRQSIALWEAQQGAACGRAGG
jgi:GntR family negative regulator for fad regulon and positive regulator of fabA